MPGATDVTEDSAMNKWTKSLPHGVYMLVREKDNS